MLRKMVTLTQSWCTMHLPIIIFQNPITMVRQFGDTLREYMIWCAPDCDSHKNAPLIRLASKKANKAIDDLHFNEKKIANLNL